MELDLMGLERAMHDAVSENDLELALTLLQDHPILLNHRLQDCDQEGWLHQAAVCDAKKLVVPLIQAGVDVNMKDEFGRTPLLLAVSYQRMDIVESLLDHGADPMIKDNREQIAMDIAIRNGDVKAAKIIINKIADLDVPFVLNTSLHLSVSYGYQNVIKMLLEFGADPCFRGEEGMRALDIARSRKLGSYNYQAVVDMLEGRTNAAEAHRVIQSMSEDKMRPSPL